MRAPVVAALLLAGALSPARAQDPPPPPKPPPAPVPTEETLQGLRVTLLVPAGAKPEEGWSLLVILHAHTQTGKQVVAAAEGLAARGFVIAAPWSRQAGWTDPEVEAVGRIAKELVDRFRVARERRHVAGFWYGANLLPKLAFDEKLGFRTSTWIDCDWGGGTVPKGAKEEMHGLFLWGAREGPSRAESYRKSASLMADKVRLATVRGEEPDPAMPLGRSRKEDPEFPATLLPFWGHFLECMEGRFTPGRDLSFEWQQDLATARAGMEQRKRGGFAYVWAANPGKEEWERTRTLQNLVFFDRAVRHFGEQLVPVMIEKSKAVDLLAEAKVAETPAVIVFKKGGREVLKSASGDVTAKVLIPLLRAVAADQELPK